MTRLTDILSEHYHRVELATDQCKTDCQKGCALCCHLPVPVTVPELLPILDILKEDKDLKDRVNNHDGPPCPFLEGDSSCAIYENRPFYCRAHISTDRCHCEARLYTGIDRIERVPDESRAAIAHNRLDLKNRLRGQQLDARDYKMVEALKHLLHEQDIEDRWFDGEEVVPRELKA